MDDFFRGGLSRRHVVGAVGIGMATAAAPAFGQQPTKSAGSTGRRSGDRGSAFSLSETSLQKANSASCATERAAALTANTSARDCTDAYAIDRRRAILEEAIQEDD